MDPDRAPSARTSGPDVRVATRGRLTGCSPPAGERGAGGWLGRYLRRVEVVTRGPVSVVVTIAVFAAASAVGSAAGGRAGVVVASAWVLFSGTYCLLNFWHCRETHCVVTGTGWTPLGLLGFAAALAPGTSLSWYRVDVEVAAYLVILGAGYTLQCVVAARTGHRALR